MNEKTLSFIHRYLPGRGEEGKTTLLMLHGTGGTENDLVSLGELLLPDAAVLSPRGKVLENGMPRFFRRLAEGVFDVEDLRQRSHELADFIEEASTAYGLDPHRVIAVGYSNGANIAGGILLLRPEVFSGAILFRPMVPLVPDQLPDLSSQAVFVSSGERDPIVPPEESRRLVELLASAGAKVAVHWHQGGHELSDEDLQAAQLWLQMEFQDTK